MPEQELAMPDTTAHPTPRALALFAHGKLSEAQAATVAAHLESCAACRQAVADLPPDSFLGKLRAAQPGGSCPPPAAPARSVASGSMAGPSAVPSALPADVPPELANRPKFKVVRELGRGGMGVIYLAQHRLLDKPVALKVINPAVLDSPEALKRFRAEARAAAQLDHPNIARAYDADQAGPLHFLVMEFVEGLSLAQLLERQGPLPVADACRYVSQAALGLQHAYEQGMVHRDVKPHNLMLTPKGLVKVLDFGLARVRTEHEKRTRLTQLDSFLGTPEYVAPEQAMSARDADTRADIYSLGCTLYALLAGRPPFQEGNPTDIVLAHTEEECQPVRAMRPDVPPILSRVVTKMMAKDPAARPQTPGAVARVLAPYCEPAGQSGVTTAATVPPGVLSARTDTRLGSNSRVVKGSKKGAARTSFPTRPTRAAEEEGSASGTRADNPPLKMTKKTGQTATPAPAWWKPPPVLASVGAVLLALAGAAAALLALSLGAGLAGRTAFEPGRPASATKSASESQGARPTETPPAARQPKSVMQLIEDVKNGDSRARLEAANTLTERGPAAALVARRQLVEALKDRDPALRLAVAKALARIPEAGTIPEVGAVLALADEATEADDYEEAERLAKIAQASTTAPTDLAAAAAARARVKEVAALREAYEAIPNAVRALGDKPHHDSDAHLALGRFYALAKGDWDRGLSMLARGSDAKLRTLAQTDLASPANAKATEELGDGYAAQATSESGAAKTNLWCRACYWYEQAEGKLSGPDRTRVQRKVAAIDLRLTDV
jgi:serine/threonine protein kinase